MLKIKWCTHIPDYPVFWQEYHEYKTLEEAKNAVDETNANWSLLDSHYIGVAIFMDADGNEQTIYEYKFEIIRK